MFAPGLNPRVCSLVSLGLMMALKASGKFRRRLGYRSGYGPGYGLGFEHFFGKKCTFCRQSGFSRGLISQLMAEMRNNRLACAGVLSY
jgi:hypothetical protein